MKILEETSSRLVLSFIDVNYSKLGNIIFLICFSILLFMFLFKLLIIGGSLEDALLFMANEGFPASVLLIINFFWLGRQNKFYIFDKDLKTLSIQNKLSLGSRYTVSEYYLTDINSIQVEKRSFSGVYGIGSEKFTVIISVLQKIWLQTDDVDSFSYLDNIASKMRKYVA